MRKTNRKGFTIVELVIVIAVIAILAAVLIPTFASIVNKANASNLQQSLAIARKNVLAENAADNEFSEGSLYYFCETNDAHDIYVWSASENKFVEYTGDEITVDANDVVYAAQENAAAYQDSSNTFMPVGLVTADVATGDSTGYVQIADLKKIVVLKVVAD